MKLIALIVAAGKGERMAGGGAALPKQYQPIAGKAMVRHSAELLATHEAVSEVICTIRPDHEAQFAEAFEGGDAPKTVHGGATRQESVLNGLRAAQERGASHILIHDAARPALSTALVDRLVAALQAGHEAVIPAIPVADSLKEVREEEVVRPVSRENVHQVQTPQAFALESLIALHEAAARAGNVGYTDDAGLFEAAQKPVHVVAGERVNMKVTYAEDVAMVEAIIHSSLKEESKR